MPANREEIDEVLMDRLSSVSPNDLGHRFHFGIPKSALEYMGVPAPLPVVGRAMTVRAPPEDSAVVHKATEIAEDDEVIIVDMKGHKENAPWGEMTTRAAINSGAAGAIIDGSITDSEIIRELEFPVYARRKSVRTTRLHGRGGEINCPVQIAGATVRPGDVVLGNADGVIFLPPEDVETAVEYGEQIKENESEFIRKLNNGQSLADITDANELLDDR